MALKKVEDYSIRYEAELDHDVMAHIYAYSDVADEARPIIHLGATSAYVVDNTDIIVAREALQLLRTKIVSLMQSLSAFALQYKDVPTLAYTHFQAAQLTTVGKRATLWIESLRLDLVSLDHQIATMALRGAKGTTGTAGSFKTLLMELVKQGKDRQEAHEKLRVLAMQAGDYVKKEGKENNFIDLIKADSYFSTLHHQLDSLLDPKNFIGFASEQEESYLTSLRLDYSLLAS